MSSCAHSRSPKNPAGLDSLLVTADHVVVLAMQVHDEPQAIGDPVGEPAQTSQRRLRGPEENLVGEEDSGQAGARYLREQPAPEGFPEPRRVGLLLSAPFGRVLELCVGLDEEAKFGVPRPSGSPGVEDPSSDNAPGCRAGGTGSRYCPPCRCRCAGRCPVVCPGVTCRVRPPTGQPSLLARPALARVHAPAPGAGPR
jgi:hypothetical protein